MSAELTEALLSTAAGCDVMKLARAYLAQGQVLSFNWTRALLRGVVQSGEMSFRASLVLKSDTDIENLCGCREAREWGKICAHAVGVGLHWLKGQQAAVSPASARASSGSPAPSAPAKRRSVLVRAPNGEAAGLFIILPPNLDQALPRGKLMLVFEAKWSGGRLPLNALPPGRAVGFSVEDALLLYRIV